ncbi:MAG: 30S ribosomal protein S1 [Candidatus Omnitrophota bacterium]|nr:30S ribosomal protein S1 [Candidatus Omnitrophota bacterium]
MTKEVKQEKEVQEGFNLEEAYGKTFRRLSEGDIVKGKVLAIGVKDVYIDLGYKSEGIISIGELKDMPDLKTGDEFDVFVESKENEDGLITVSRRKAEKMQGWDKVAATCQEGDFIEGKVSRKVKGGLMVDVGIEAFLPASLVALKGFGNVNQLIGQTLLFKIVKMNKPRKNIVVSRKDAIMKEKETIKTKVLGELKVGDLRKGLVKNITDFGVFVDLGGVDGLLHITDMSWGRISHPSEMVAIGDTIEVVILNFDKENMKVSLGLKQKTENPWKDVESRYSVGARVKGKVVNIMPYGAFVELEKGVEGLVHVSELSWTVRVNNPQDVLAIGDMVEAIVLSVDSTGQKISLGVKQIEPNPWLEIKEKLSPGMKAEGKVRNLTDYGAFIEIEGGIEGFVHINDMSWTKKINNPKEYLKKGQKIDVMILAVDAENQKISLGIKQLTSDPWSDIMKKYSLGATIEGVITKITTFGLFVEMERDLEGLVHISELDMEPSGNLEELYKVGDKITAVVIKVDDLERKIRLSIKKTKE